MMIVVSDTSPIINLAAIGHLHLLPDLFTQLILPSSVYEEIVVTGAGEPGANEVKDADWIKIIPTSNEALLSELLIELDTGEAEAIVLALQLHADYILMDETAGRAIAISYKLQPLGLLGILLKAKQKGLIKSVTHLMDRLMYEANFYIDKTLYQFVKKSANE